MLEIGYSTLQFFERFTPEERAAIRLASQSDQVVADFMQLATAAQMVINTDPMTLAGMDYLVGVGVLTSARREEILGG